MTAAPPSDPTDPTDPAGTTGAGPDLPGRHLCTRRQTLRAAAALAAAAGALPALAACDPPGVHVDVADVPVGGGVVLSQAAYVVTQPTEGSFRAFGRACPHAGAKVTSVADGQVICARHDSRFSADDGSVLSGPATRGLTRHKVSRSDDTLTVTA